MAAIVRSRNLNETTKTDSREKIAGRIELLHEIIELGLKAMEKKVVSQPGVVADGSGLSRSVQGTARAIPSRG